MTRRGRLAIDRRGDVACMSLDGEIDLANRDGVLEDILSAASGGVRRVVLDLSRVVYLDSAGVRLVFDAARDLARLGVDLVLVQPSAAYVARILRLAAVDETVPTFASASAAFEGE